ncbi:hypothetical protein VUR80DRAFT_8820 [Thermomyces stellatus]
MRIVLLPISTKRTLLYCIHSNTSTPGRPGLADRLSTKVANVWASWEHRESGWQRKVADYGNHALRRIPYQEWGLKSVPPLTRRRRSDELAGKEKVELEFPGSVIGVGEAERILQRLGMEREALHRMRLMWCFVGMPITIPVALIPIIPNLPFFYLAYRAWSHWRAIKGSQHIQFLIKNKLPSITPSPVLDAIYATPRLPRRPPPDADTGASPSEKTSSDEGPEPDEEILVTPDIGKKLSVALEHPEIEFEIDRALWQVEQQREKAKAGADSDGSKRRR